MGLVQVLQTQGHSGRLVQTSVQIHRIRKFLGLCDPYLLVRDTDPYLDRDHSIIKQNS
jgi:hypothetical protein